MDGALIKDKTFGFYAIDRKRQQKSQTVDTGGVYPQFEGSFPAPFRDLLMVSKLVHHFNSAESLSFQASLQRNTSREGLRVDPNGALNAGCPAGAVPLACGTLQAPGSAFGKPTDICSLPRQLQLGVCVNF